ncbi:MAG: hypothetical protein ACTMHL_01110 [Janibacter sp.]
MTGEPTRFRARTIRASTLDVLTGAVRGDLSVGRRAGKWDELIDAGMATAPGVLGARWREVLAEAAGAPIAMELHSRMGGAGMFSAISSSPTPSGTSTSRSRDWPGVTCG